jgi:5'-nucleotidase
MPGRPRILLCNDDGLGAPGIQAAAEALREMGELWISAPETERSSYSHAMTLNRPVFVERVATRTYSVSGTPGDAAFIALAGLMPARPDLVVSGINRGPNLGKDVVYSGTVAAAREGAFRGLRSMAVSLDRGTDYSFAAEFLTELASTLLERRIPFPRLDAGGVLLNVNVPAGQPRGVKWTRLGKREYGDNVIKRKSPRGHTYFWINGGPLEMKSPRGTDVHAVVHGHISVTPLVVDLTEQDAYHYLRDEPPF